jgi:hypothetical protein
MGAAGVWTRQRVRARVRVAEAQCPAQLKRKVHVVLAGLIQTSTGRHASPAMGSGGEGDQPRQATCLLLRLTVPWFWFAWCSACCCDI